MGSENVVKYQQKQRNKEENMKQMITEKTGLLWWLIVNGASRFATEYNVRFYRTGILLLQMILVNIINDGIRWHHGHLPFTTKINLDRADIIVNQWLGQGRIHLKTRSIILQTGAYLLLPPEGRPISFCMELHTNCICPLVVELQNTGYCGFHWSNVFLDLKITENTEPLGHIIG